MANESNREVEMRQGTIVAVVVLSLLTALRAQGAEPTRSDENQEKNQVPSTESLVTTKLYPEFREALVRKAKDWHRRAWMLLLHSQSLAIKPEDKSPKDKTQKNNEEKTAKGPAAKIVESPSQEDD